MTPSTPVKLADLIVVGGDPTARISEIRRVKLVVKNGTIVKPGQLYEARGLSAGK